jgi:hypothetical protein
MDESIQLLQKIADNTAHDNSMWVAIIAGGAGVLGATLTALFSYLIARKTQQTEEKRLRASVVTTERLRWLQDIRQRLSHYFVQMDMQYNYLHRPIPPGEKAAYQETLDNFSNEVNEQCNIIFLMLNPEKENQNNLRTAVQDGLRFIRECVKMKNSGSSSFDDNLYKAIKQKAFDSLTIIGIETWDRIKRLD